MPGVSGTRPPPQPSSPTALDPEHWPRCREYLYGIDLFNAGFAWEAHEAWEGVWHACGRRGEPADLLRGLIKLAAAAVKLRQGMVAGAGKHGVAAVDLLASLAGRVGADVYCGVSLAELQRRAEACAAGRPMDAPLVMAASTGWEG